MFDKRTIAAGLRTEAAKREFHLLYGGTERTAAEQADRYEALLTTYAEHFAARAKRLRSSPPPGARRSWATTPTTTTASCWPRP